MPMCQALRLVRILAVAGFCVLAGAYAALAQECLAMIEGAVAAATGKPLAGITLAARNERTGVRLEIVSDAGGRYRFAGLLPGLWRVEAGGEGFEPAAVTGVALSAGSRRTLDFVLETGRIREAVIVAARLPEVETTRSDLGGVVDRARLDTLPLLHRDFSELALLVPGVYPGRYGEPRASALPEGVGELLVDGTGDEELVRNTTRTPVPLDAVEEFRVISDQAPAEYGNSAGLVQAAVSRTGTNAWHGRAAWFFRDDALDSPNYFVSHAGYGGAEQSDAAPPPYRHNNVTASLGGPLHRDTTHLFFAYEALRETTYATITSPLVPSETVDQGNRRDQFFLNLQHAGGPRDLFSARLLYCPSRMDNLGPGGYATRSTATNVDNDPLDVQLNWTRQVPVGAINELRLLLARRESRWYSPDYPDSYYESRPSGEFGKFWASPQEIRERRVEALDNLTLFRQDHTFKFGLDLAYNPLDATVSNYIPGAFYFDTDAPFDPANVATYLVVAVVNTGPSDFRMPMWEIGLFAEDTWRVRPALTLNLGVRLSHYSCRGLDYKALDIRQINPRLGFCWDPAGQGRLVIRGGFGIFSANPMANAAYDMVVTNNLRYDTIYLPNYPDPRQDNPFWAQLGTDRAHQTVASDSPLADHFRSKPGLVAPWTTQLTLGAQGELGAGVTAAVDFAWIRGRRLLRMENPNAVIPGTWDPQSGTGQRYADNSRGNDWVMSDGGRSDFKGIYVFLKKKYAHRFLLDVSYTLSWAKADVESELSQLHQNDDFQWQREYGYSRYDSRHRLALAGILDLPLEFQFSGLVWYRSAPPWTAVYGFDQNLDGTLFVSDGYADYVDTVRNSRRGFDFFRIDARLSKSFRIEICRFQLLIEAFNLTNRANFTDIDTVLTGNPGFGQPVAAADPRLVRLGIRLDF